MALTAQHPMRTSCAWKGNGCASVRRRSSSVPASSARAPRTTSRSSGSPTCWCSTRGRCSRPGAPPRTRPAWSSRRTAPARWPPRRVHARCCTARSRSTANPAGTRRWVEVATTPARMEELKRRRGFARSYGIADTELLTPTRRASGSRCSTGDQILGALLRSERRRREGGPDRVGVRAAKASAGRDVRGRRDGHRVRHPRRARAGVDTDRGDGRVRTRVDLRRDLGPAVGALAGVPIPLVAVQHQLVWTDPIPELAGETRGGRPPDPAPPGHVDVLPPARGSLRAWATIATSRSSRRSDIRPPATARAALTPFTPEDFAVAERETERLLPAARGPHASRRPRALDQRHVLVHARRRLHRGRVREGPRPLGVRGRVGHPRRRHGPEVAEWMDERRALDGHGRGGREPLLPVHDHAAVRARHGARSSTARSTTSCIRCSR